MKNNKVIQPRLSKDSLHKFISSSSISGSIWRAPEIYALSQYSLCRPVLDIGCGDGHFNQIVYKDQFDFGIDISQASLLKAKKRKTYKKLFFADANKIPIKKGQVQTVFSNSVFKHIIDLDSVLKEVNRVLKSGGDFIFTTHHPLSKNYYGAKMLRSLGFGMLAKQYEKIYLGMHQLKTTWTLQQWKEKLKKYGFTIEDSKAIVSSRDYFFYEFFMPLTFIQNRIPFLKKIYLTYAMFILLHPDYKNSQKNGHNLFIKAKKLF